MIVYMHTETGSTDTKEGWIESYAAEELEERRLTAEEAFEEDEGLTLIMCETVEFRGKTYALTEQADFSNRRLEFNDWSDAAEGEEYDFEMQAQAVDENGDEYMVYWIFSTTKGDEAELDSYDYDTADRVESL